MIVVASAFLLTLTAALIVRGAPTTLHEGSGADESWPTTKAVGVDVIHNPPLIFDSRQPSKLSFELVCPGTSCGGGVATLQLLPEGAATSKVSRSFEGDTVQFEIDPESLQSGQVRYALEVSTRYGVSTYPDRGSMPIVSLGAPVTVDLKGGAFDAERQEQGKEVARFGWGGGPEQLGRSGDIGPRSFDVSQAGELVVLDQVNGRFVFVDPGGHRRNIPVSLGKGELDVAFAPDGSVVVLYANAVSGARVERFSRQGGKALEEIALATSSGNAIRRIGSTLYVEGDDSYWLPIMTGDRVLTPEEQEAGALGGQTDGRSIVIRKHLRDLANAVLVVELSGDEAVSYRLTDSIDLGPVFAAVPTASGAVVVLSRFDNEQAEYLVAVLPKSGKVQHYSVAMADAIDMYSAVRVVDGRVYIAQRTADSFVIAQFEGMSR